MDSLDRFLGNAASDATPEQRERLRTDVLPLLQGPYYETGDEHVVRCAVADVMGWVID
jgi:hypothetical protein